MLIVFAAWSMIFCSLAGLGYLVKLFFRSQSAGFSLVMQCFWLGFAITIATLQIWNFFVPVDWKAGIVIGGVGLVGFIGLLTSLKRINAFNKEVAVSVLLLLPLTFWLTHRALAAPVHYDSGLYHFNSIRWANQYSIVPGLGNLHGRLAFNQSYLLYVAALNVYPFANQGHHFANSLLVYVLAAGAIGNSVRMLFNPVQHTIPRVFQALCLPIIIVQAASPTDFSSPTSDLPVFILQLVLISQFMEWLFCAPEPEDRDDFAVFSVFVLAIAGITIKLNLIVFSVLIITLLLGVRLRQYGDWRIAFRQPAIWLALGLCGLVLPWVLRSIILSGYIVYPGGLGAVPVDWRVPAATAVDDANWIRSWARQPGAHWSQVLGGWGWFGPWLQKIAQMPEIMLPLALCAIGMAGSIVLSLFVKSNTIIRRAWLLFLPPLCSLVFWFVSAPEPRFAGSAFWIIGVLGVALPLDLLCRLKPHSIPRTLVALALGASVFVVASDMLLIRQATCEGFCPIPVVQMQEFRTTSGLTLYIPRVDDRSWDSQLPSTPYPNPNLELRGTDLQSGFRVRPAP